MLKHDKAAVASSFGRAAETYDAAAHFQRKVGRHLLTMVPDQVAGQLLDLGCGTGYFVKELAEKNGAPVVALDLSPGMLEVVKTQHGAEALPLQADAEALPLRTSSVDLVFSSLAIQWCNDLDLLFNEVARVLRPGGRFAFATLLDGTLDELKSAWRAADSFQHVNDFFSRREHESAAGRAEFSSARYEQHTDVLYYETLKELTRELKMIGAHNVNPDRPKNISGRARIKALFEAYEQFRHSEYGLPASYEVLYGVLQKN